MLYRQASMRSSVVSQICNQQHMFGVKHKQNFPNDQASLQSSIVSQICNKEHIFGVRHNKNVLII